MEARGQKPKPINELPASPIAVPKVEPGIPSARGESQAERWTTDRASSQVEITINPVGNSGTLTVDTAETATTIAKSSRA